MRKIARLGSVTIFLFIALSACPAPAATIHVPSDQPTIQAGIDAAFSGDLVLVAPGSYLENIELPGRAIILESEAGAEETVIDGNGEAAVVTFDSWGTGNTAIEGFTIRNGLAVEGGGIHCNLISPRIVNCVITENLSFMGGGIFCKFSSPTITSCTITDNTSVHGGGIFCYSSFPTITNCTISGNSAGRSMAGRGAGGGISIFYSDPTITNCLITGNNAGDRGGGIHCYTLSYPTITNCTLSDNIAPHVGGVSCYDDASPTITNSIIWGNTDVQTNCDCTEHITYSDIGDECPGEGNIDANPDYIGAGDYHLQCDVSPCVDAGTNDAPELPPTDRDGNSRVCDGVADMGAYECPGEWCEECIDGDDDGYGSPAGLLCPHSEEDCDDLDPASYPGAPDPCDGVDQACDGPGDEVDADDDGQMVCDGDCDDADPLVHPEVDEICENEIDDDCDDLVDGDDPDCADFRLEMEAFCEEGTLSLEFLLGAPEPATWSNYMIVTSPGLKVIPLWETSLQVIHPPWEGTIAIPVSSIGWVEIATVLISEEGFQAIDYARVDTGG